MTFRVADLDLFLTLPSGQRRWRYRTDDALAAVLAPGYFDHADAPAWAGGGVIEVRARGGVGRVVIGGATKGEEPAPPAPAPAPDPLLAVRLAGMPRR